MIKVVYAQSRQPGISRDGFARLWREHAGIAMTASDFWDPVRLYVQGDALHDASSVFSRDYDGVGELHFGSLDDRNASRDSASSRAVVLPHGAKIFGSERPLYLVGQETVAREGRTGRFKVYEFLRRRPDRSRAEFLAAWDARGIPSGDPSLRRTRSASVLADSEFDGVEETDFNTADEARRAHGEAARLGLVAQDLLAERIAILTEQIVLYRHANFVEGG